MHSVKSFCQGLNDRDASRVLKVFLSSTFRDFQKERDYLWTYVFPAIRREAKTRGVELIPIDLRTGLTDDESKLGGAVAVCLDEVDRSRPCFIGMIGERYGWIPKSGSLPELSHLEAKRAQQLREWFQAEESVTAMEIRHGVLDNEGERLYSYFYLRDKKLTEDLSKKSENHIEFFENEDSQDFEELKRRKLQELKQEIWEGAEEKGWHVYTYQTLEGDPESFVERVKSDLLQALNEQFPLKQKPDEQPPLLSSPVMIAQNLLGAYVPNEEFLDGILQKIKRNEVVFLRGESGSGKSVALSWLAKEFCRHNPDAFVFVHFANNESDVNSMNGAVIDLIQNALNLSDKMTPSELWKKLCHHISEERPCLIVIDGLRLEHFPKEGGGVRDFFWYRLPHRQVSLLFSGIEAVPYIGNDAYIDIPYLTDQQIPLIIKETLDKHRKHITDAQFDQLRQSFIRKNPLYLKVFLELLITEGRLKKELQESQDEFINQILNEYLSCADVPALYGKMFERLEKNFPPDNLNKFLLCLDFTRLGMTVNDIGDVIGIPAIDVATYRYYFNEHLTERNGLLSSSNIYLKAAISKRFGVDNGIALLINENLYQFFASMDASPRKFEELPWVLLKSDKGSNRNEELFRLLLSPEFCQYSVDKKKHSVREEYYDLWKHFYLKFSDAEIIRFYEAIGYKDLAAECILSHSVSFESDLFDRLSHLISMFKLPVKDSTRLNALRSRGYESLRKGKYDQAAEDFQKIFENKMQSLGAWNIETIKTANILLEINDFRISENKIFLEKYIDSLMKERGLSPPYTTSNFEDLVNELSQIYSFNDDGFILRLESFISMM